MSTAGETEGGTTWGSCGNSYPSRISPQEFLCSYHGADREDSSVSSSWFNICSECGGAKAHVCKRAMGSAPGNREAAVWHLKQLFFSFEHCDYMGKSLVHTWWASGPGVHCRFCCEQGAGGLSGVYVPQWWRRTEPAKVMSVPSGRWFKSSCQRRWQAIVPYLGLSSPSKND